MITTETYAGLFEHSETLNLEDRSVEGVLRRTAIGKVPTALQQIMAQNAEQHLRRAAE